MDAPGEQVRATTQPLTLFLGGDVMTGRGIDQILAHSCPSRLYEPVVTSALEYVALAEQRNGPIPRDAPDAYVWGVALDVLDRVRPATRIVNLETSITTCGRAVPKGINYRMHPRNVGLVRAAGIDCCVLSNNHVLDWGADGLLETLDVLAAAGVPTAGAGSDRQQASAPAVLPVGGGHRIILLACGARDSGIPASWAAGEHRAGVHLLPDFTDDCVDTLARIVAALRRSGDVVVLSIHWGGNWGFRIAAAHRRFAHALIDREAVDIVHGHSSHHPQAIEVHRGRLILYGCGDLVNDYEGIRGHEPYRHDLVLMYFPVVDTGSGQLKQLRMVPLQLRHFRLNWPTADDRDRLRSMLDRECRRFGGGVRADGDDLLLDW